MKFFKSFVGDYVFFVSKVIVRKLVPSWKVVSFLLLINFTDGFNPLNFYANVLCAENDSFTESFYDDEFDLEDLEDLGWEDFLEGYHAELSFEDDTVEGAKDGVFAQVFDNTVTEGGGLTEGEDLEKNDYGILHDIYLYKGELDAPLICKKIFPRMLPEQVNESFRDVRKFIQNYSRTTLCEDRRKIGEIFLRDILHVYGHIFTFAQNARVDMKTKRVFVPEVNDRTIGTRSLVDYWWLLEHEVGLKLHVYKFYASCIDYLTVMIHSYMTFPCFDKKQLREMDDRWLWWLEKVTSKLSEDPVFGGYYQENARLFREVFSLWKSDFDSKQELKKKLHKLDRLKKNNFVYQW